MMFVLHLLVDEVVKSYDLVPHLEPRVVRKEKLRVLKQRTKTKHENKTNPAAEWGSRGGGGGDRADGGEGIITIST